MLNFSHSLPWHFPSNQTAQRQQTKERNLNRGERRRAGSESRSEPLVPHETLSRHQSRFGNSENQLSFSQFAWSCQTPPATAQTAQLDFSRQPNRQRKKVETGFRLTRLLGERRREKANGQVPGMNGETETALSLRLRSPMPIGEGFEGFALLSPFFLLNTSKPNYCIVFHFQFHSLDRQKIILKL